MKTSLRSCPKSIYIYSILVFGFFCPFLTMAQTGGITSSNFGIQQEALKVYIDYAESDNTERYLRSEISFASFVRDPHLAQIHVLITDQKTGSGGRKFKISFIGQEEFSGQDQNLYYISPQSDTDDQRREGLAKVIKMGLMPYVSQTSAMNQIQINFNTDKFKSLDEKIYDSWDFWIFYIDFGGGFNAEESRNAYTITSSVNADRITDLWKSRNSFRYFYEEENFTDDGESLKSTLKSWKEESSVILSLSNKWSAGVFGDVYSTTFRNIKLGFSFASGIEYNIFPWFESERKAFTFGYQIGYSYFNYFEATLFDKIEENLLFHSFTLELEMTQPWGEIDLELEAQQYLELKNTYSLKMDVEFAFRISTGLEFILESRMESIHDQFYLPKGDATIDEILLRRRQLATTYDIGLAFGFRYTFGSIYNNIVNRRM